jgi:hypothetical protein
LTVLVTSSHSQSIPIRPDVELTIHPAGASLRGQFRAGRLRSACATTILPLIQLVRRICMSTLLDEPLTRPATDPAHRLRAMTAAVRVSFTWLGTRKTLGRRTSRSTGTSTTTDSRRLDTPATSGSRVDHDVVGAPATIAGVHFLRNPPDVGPGRRSNFSEFAGPSVWIAAPGDLPGWQRVSDLIRLKGNRCQSDETAGPVLALWQGAGRQWGRPAADDSGQIIQPARSGSRGVGL